jgi:hypothetical protein
VSKRFHARGGGGRRLGATPSLVLFLALAVAGSGTAATHGGAEAPAAALVDTATVGELDVDRPDSTTVGEPAVARPDTAEPAAVPDDSLRIAAAEAALAREVDVWSTGVSPTAAVLMTPVFPGWGQLYSDSTWRAGLAFGTQMFYWANLLQRDRKARRISDHARTLPEGPQRDAYDALAAEFWEQMRDFAWWSGGILLIVALDAYVGAHLFRFEEDPLPVPDRWDEYFGPAIPEPPGSVAAPTVAVFCWQIGF